MWSFRSDGRLLAEESEAFLDGTFAELCEARRRSVPVWAWMNVLAHGTLEDLAVSERRLAPGPWRAARAYVAGELLDRLGWDEAGLSAFQSTVLVPLELDLASCRAADRWSPGQLFGGLLGTLPPARRSDADVTGGCGPGAARSPRSRPPLRRGGGAPAG